MAGTVTSTNRLVLTEKLRTKVSDLTDSFKVQIYHPSSFFQHLNNEIVLSNQVIEKVRGKTKGHIPKIDDEEFRQVTLLFPGLNKENIVIIVLIRRGLMFSHELIIVRLYTAKAKKSVSKKLFISVFKRNQ